MNLIQFQGALELGLIYSLVALGVFLSFRVLRFPDLTVDGSFPLGAAVCASMISQGYHPWVSLLISTFSGALIGIITAQLSNYLKMLNLLAGILTMSALYSINLRVLNHKANLSILGEPTVFHTLPQSSFACLMLLSIGVLLVYRLLISTALNMSTIGLQAADLNLITAVMVIVSMGLPKLKRMKLPKQIGLKVNS